MLSDFIKPSGINFSLTDELPAAELCKALCRTASFLQGIEAHGTPLRCYHDWWQHDGLHFYGGLIEFRDLFEMIQSPRNLLHAMTGDESVFVGIAPEHVRWYLRFYLTWDDEGFNLLGRFDVTVPHEEAGCFRTEVAAPLHLMMDEQDAARYYGSIGV